MSFTIPNAISYGVSIATLEQAEPDTLDFTTLGDRSSGVLSGAGITSTAISGGNYITVALAASEVAIAGSYGSITAATLTIGAPTASNTRFDLICADSSPSFGYVVVPGTASSTNPIFPTLTATQIPLYAVIVKAGLTSGPIARLIVDKRTLIGPTVLKKGSTTPSGGSSGDMYYRTGSSPATGQSTIWLNNSGTWENLAKYVAMGTTGTSNLVLRDASGNFSAGTITATTFSGALSGNASTATSAAAWTTARTLTVSGAATGSVSIKGDGAMSLALTTTLPSIYVGAAPGSPKANDLWIQV